MILTNPTKKPEQEMEDAIARQVSELFETVGGRVRNARRERGMSRRELSERSGVSPRYLAQLEAGDGNISIGLLKRISAALDLPLEQFLSEHEPVSAEADIVGKLFAIASPEVRSQVMELLDPEKTVLRKAERICLIGLRGAGKSTLGSRLAEQFDMPFVELREQIEHRAGMPTGEIIALYGPEGYRELEASALQALVAEQSRIVLAVAGGIVAEQETFAHLLENFHTIWVKAAPNEHMERVRAQGDLRPMQDNPQAMDQLRQILSNRRSQYERADFHLNTEGKSIEKSAEELCSLIVQNRLVT